MKNLNSFEAFRLGKSQMAKLSGGTVVCDVYYTDGMGGSFPMVFHQANKEQAKKVAQAQHPDAQVSCWVLDETPE